MSFATTISKEEIRKLPLMVFENNIHIIDTQEKITSAISKLNTEKLVGFDTETKPAFKKGTRHKVALIQIATETDAYLFRINKTGFTQPLIDFFENPAILKIGADTKLDLQNLHQLHPFTPAGFVDIQKLAKDKGIQDLSLRKLTGIVLGKRISKRQQLSNWERSELTQGQANYAATDAFVCLRIYKTLNQ